MSSGPLPPVPDLIPIAALLKPTSTNNNSGPRRECAPCATHSEVMGEQRSRRTAKQPSVDLIDSVQSRGPSAAPQAPQSRKARSERHRKSDRRREHRKPARTRSGSKHSSKSREPSTPERPANPRVNPIFVWVRQEDTRIVDVKCEDYDKRNRILLTKTAQGWRAIPRTETLVPSIKDAKHHHHHHHRNRKSRKSKVRRKSTAVQVDSDFQDVYKEYTQRTTTSSPTWSCPVNVESHLPSHKIRVPKKCPSPSNITDSPSVNSIVNESAQSPEEKCSVARICDVSPLDNLLAVAEFEFNQHMQSGEWDKDNEQNDEEDAIKASPYDEEEIDDDQKEFIDNMEQQLNNLIDSCSKSEIKTPNEFEPEDIKTEECDYTEDDDNNLAMDDILSRLEQSLRSPECSEITQALNECSENFGVDDDVEEIEEASSAEYKIDIKENDFFTTSDINENNYKTVPDELDSLFTDEPTESKDDIVVNCQQTPPPTDGNDVDDAVATDDVNQLTTIKEGVEKPHDQEIVESSTPSVQTEDEPTDLSIKTKYTNSTSTNDFNENCNNMSSSNSSDEPEQPTDLTLPKNNKDMPSPSPVRSITPRPPSQNSEAIQSPQPSGIPAVPHSPDIVSPSAKTKSTVFLDSLLTTTSQKIALNSEVTIIKQKEPLDLGKSRKSASPTITCSEEVKSNADLSEPPAKKFKLSNNNNNLSLKNLLDIEAVPGKPETGNKALVKNPTSAPETPRLLELLKTDSGPDPLTQLRQILYDTNLNVPDPMLVPKERLSQIISHPGREIPRLLKQRPELRLPEALAFPHLLQDPDILVITLQQLETIILKQNQSLSLKELKTISSEPAVAKPDKPQHKKDKPAEGLKENHSSTSANKKKHSEDHVTKMMHESAYHHQQQQKSSCNELATDIDAATAAAFNQMIWMPYFDQLQAMSFGNGSGGNADVMKMLSNSLPMYPGQLPELNRLSTAANRFPPPSVNFPMQPPPTQMNYNALELSMWQEAMMQANMLRPKLPFDGLNQKNSFRDYLDKFSFGGSGAKTIPPLNKLPNHMNKSTNNVTSNFFPHPPNGPFPFLNMPANNFSNNSKQQQQQQNMAMPHFNPALFSQKNLINQQKAPASSSSHSYLLKQQRLEQKMNFANFYQQKMEESKHKHHEHKGGGSGSKVSCKSFANVGYKHQEKTSASSSNNGDFTKHHHTQPIDLSGSTAPTSKLKVKQHLIDPANAAKLLKHHDDIPEVGSTTASVEEMQDAHKHLWHPLFGNQKGYHSPWNWTTVTATGE